MSNNYSKLRPYNFIMGIVHLLQGIAMIVLSNDTITKIDIWLPKPDFESRSISLEPQDFIDVNFGVLISSFLFISAIAHFLTVTPGIYEWYLKNIKREINLIRWYEYALSSSVMIVVIAYLCNILDATILGLLFMINACMNLFGASMELHNADLKEKADDYKKLSALVPESKKSELEPERSNYKTNWHSFVYGCIAGLTPWIPLAIYFIYSISQLDGRFEVPAFVYYVLYILFVFFNLFAINMFLQYKKIGKWKSYLFGEYVYIFLSLAAKSTLAWIIWGGTLR
jgi:Heliorhodopsin